MTNREKLAALKAKAKPAEPQALIEPPAQPLAIPPESGKITVTFACGCRQGFYLQEKGRCRQCATKAKAKEKAARKAARKEKWKDKQPDDAQRLPDGSDFKVKYNAATKTWSGSLWVPGTGSFEDSAGGVMTLLRLLDAQYRAASANQVSNQNEGIR